MGKIKVTSECNGIAGLKVVEPSVFGDARGYFMETYNYNDFKEAGIDCQFVQDNQSASKKGVLRGLHFQINFPQDKLVRVVNGEVLTWRWICGKVPKLLENGLGLSYPQKTKSSFLFPRALPTALWC